MRVGLIDERSDVKGIVMVGLVVGVVFIAGLIVLNRALHRREREGAWDKEGHGLPQHQTGPQYRPLSSGPWERG